MSKRKPYRAYWTKWIYDFIDGPYDSYKVLDIICDDDERAHGGSMQLRACSRAHKYPLDVFKMGNIVRIFHLTRDSDEIMSIPEG